MHISFETIVIGVLFLGASAWGVRAAWRSLTGGGGCSGCAASGDCPMKKDPAELVDLQRRSGDSSCSELVELSAKNKSR